MKKALALLASSALLFPAAVIASPAEAAPTGGFEECDNLGCGPETRFREVIKNCTRTQHGVFVRIKMRNNGEYTRIRLSHPDGRGDFREPKIRRVIGSVDVDSGTANDREAASKLGPSYRTAPAGNGNTVSVDASFRLRNGKSISLSCRMR